MPEEATERWLVDLAAGLDGSGELTERAYLATARHLLRCTGSQAAALKGILTAERAELTRMLMQPRGAGAAAVILRFRDIIDGALWAFSPLDRKGAEALD
jgi:hypothetical protein